MSSNQRGASGNDRELACKGLSVKATFKTIMMVEGLTGYEDMETMTYYTHSSITLEDIQRIAIRGGYKTVIFECRYERLNIRFGKENSMWWQCWEGSEGKLVFEDEDELTRYRKLRPTRIFHIDYHANTLPELASFLRSVLSHYGGSVDCKGNIKELYTVDNIDAVKLGCP